MKSVIFKSAISELSIGASGLGRREGAGGLILAVAAVMTDGESGTPLALIPAARAAATAASYARDSAVGARNGMSDPSAGGAV